MLKRIAILLMILAVMLALPGSARAESYSFSLPQMTVNVYWNEDGSESIDYVYVFNNDPSGPTIEFVDVAIPNPNFNEGDITADVNGNPVSYISKSEFQGKGSGVAVALGSHSIPPGQTGTVHVFIDKVANVLRPDSKDSNYASAVFKNAYFVPEIIHGATNLSVTFHLPPGVQPDEPRWHASPSGWASEPQTGLDQQGRVTYTWANAQASLDQQYEFGASFPKKYVPASTIRSPSIAETLNVDPGALIGFVFICGFGLLMVFIGVVSTRAAQQRKLQYLPPKISIEGHGIKRGLTAVEAAILLEQPMDKILTMILFSVIKKGAAEVESREPLKLKINPSPPEDLRPYETQFMDAFSKSTKPALRTGLQDMMIDLVKDMSAKMKGFSRRETVAYYRDIMDRAWKQVEAADTPEVKSQKFDEVMEWTMLDKDYEGRTRDVFRTGPVFVPVWWPRYDPGFGRASTAGPVSTSGGGGGGGGGISLPNLPGSAFAASIVRGTQDFSSSVIGNVTDFTSKITNKTNPVPVTKSSGGWSGRGGGGGCACACACAGCACACAGGGR